MNLFNDKPTPTGTRLCYWHPDYKKPEPFVQVAKDYLPTDHILCPICQGNFIVCGHEYSNGFLAVSAASARSVCNTRTKVRYPALFTFIGPQNDIRTKQWYPTVNGLNEPRTKVWKPILNDQIDTFTKPRKYAVNDLKQPRIREQFDEVLKDIRTKYRFAGQKNQEESI